MYCIMYLPCLCFALFSLLLVASEDKGHNGKAPLNSESTHVSAVEVREKLGNTKEESYDTSNQLPPLEFDEEPEQQVSLVHKKIRKKRSYYSQWYHCPPGYSQRGQNCYKFYYSYASWYSARDQCTRDYGGRLPYIPTCGRNNEILSFLRSYTYNEWVWTSYYRAGYSYYWYYWPSTYWYSYAPWYSRCYPYYYRTYDRCGITRVLLESYGGWWWRTYWRWVYKFSNTRCYYSRRFMCQRRAVRTEYLFCRNGRTVPKSWKCNGYNDCGDYTDEIGCYCPYLYSPSYGYKSSSNTRQGTTIYFYCYSGYRRYGSYYRTCYNGVWSGSQPYCYRICCGRPSSAYYGYLYSPSGYCYGARVYQRCSTGFYLSGSGSSWCNYYGNWQGYSSCNRRYCGYPGYPTNGYIRYGYTYYYGYSVSFGCYSNYYVSGCSSITCQSNGVWSCSVPTCRSYSCSRPSIGYGYVSPYYSSYSSGNYIYYYCNSGYIRVGSSRQLCSYGSWLSSRPYCSRRSCGNPAYPSNGRQASYTGYSYGHVVTFSCNSGYVLSGASSITCQSNGLWSSGLPTCSDVNECLTNNYDGCQHNCHNSPGSSYCSCQSGYSLFSRNGINGVYLPSGQDGSQTSHRYTINKSCVGVKCATLVSPVNGTHNVSSYNYPVKAEFQCNSGFEVNGHQFLTCLTDGTWDHSVPTCKVASCKHPGAIIKGGSYPSSYLHRSTVQFYCNPGYDIQGVQVRSCDAISGGAAWSGINPTCKAKDCRTLITLSNGNLNTTITTYPTYVGLSCNQGYTLSGSSVRSCLSSGIWSGSSTHCAAKSCGNPGTPTNGLQYGINYKFGSSITYTCTKSGYVLSHNDSLTCVFNVSTQAVNWNGTKPNCIDIEAPTYDNCPSDMRKATEYGGTSAQASFTIPKFTDNSGATPIVSVSGSYPPFTFLHGNKSVSYNASDASGNKKICMFNVEVYDDENPTIDCPTYIEFGSTKAETIDTFSSEERSGTVLKTVSYTFQSSIELSTTSINITDNIGLESVSITPGNRTLISLSGSENYNIIATDTSGNQKTCSFKVLVNAPGCPPLYDPENGTISCISFFGIESCTVSCNIGYDFPQSINYPLRCASYGLWQPEPIVPDCSERRPLPCSYGLVKIAGWCVECGSGSMYNVSNNSSSCISCSIGTYQPSKNQSSCIACADGLSTTYIHSRNSSDCIAECQPGEYALTGLEPCKKCDKGSYQNNTRNKQCTACPGDTTTVSIGSTAVSSCLGKCMLGEYSTTGLAPCQLCAKGYYQDTGQSTSCKECAGLSSTIGTGAIHSANCTEIDECKSFPCMNNATCNDLLNDYNCSCKPGWTAKECQTDIDECASNPCQHNSTCTDYLNYYTCLCLPGFTGSNCEVDIDECASSPCQNAGDCRDGYNGYTCLCLDGFNGTHCETNIDECASSPCQNYATCVDGIALYNCTCSPGYTDAHCTTDIDECVSNPCLNQATCVDMVNGYRCTCLPGYTGVFCETNIDECQSNPCQYGTCVDGVNGYSCSCNPGYSGVHCQVDIDECASTPCQHNGTCSDHVNSYSCNCNSGYTGSNCQIDIDECASGPCVWGNCTDLVNGYTCSCIAGYTGVHCSVNIDECASSPCQNSNYSTCVDGINSYTCVCGSGFTGLHCETNIDECLSSPCQNGGSCTDGINKYTCTCLPGYTDQKCETDIDECASRPCQNLANCTDLLNGYTCSCVTGFVGTNCETNVDDCKTGLCANGGQCVDLINDYSCNCTAGWEGKNCSQEVDECVSQPCQNGATCTDIFASYQCQCVPGFRGSNCEENIDDCPTALKCMNGGTCIDGIQNTTCSCLLIYTGSRCQQKRSEEFDLRFYGNITDVAMYDKILPVNMSFTICIWERYALKNEPGTLLTWWVSETGATIISINDDSISFSINGDTKQFELVLNDGKWKHICATWDSNMGDIKIYLNGTENQTFTGYQAGANLSQTTTLYLGQRKNNASSFLDGQSLDGEISRVNIWSKVLTEDEIISLSSACTSNITGNAAVWPDIGGSPSGGVKTVQPSKCGTSDCPGGLEGINCDIITDTEDPEIVYCPTVESIKSKTTRTIGRWKEPSFSDNIKVHIINATHINGKSTFKWGEHEISYTAADAAGNTAQCVFSLTITPTGCPILQVPKNGITVCGHFTGGSICRAKCSDGYTATKPFDTVYICDSLGIWISNDPSLPKLPSCTGSSSTADSSSVSVNVAYKTKNCSTPFLEEAKKSMITTLVDFNDLKCGALCGAISKKIQTCNNVIQVKAEPCSLSGVAAKCKTRARRKRQADGSGTSDLIISINFNVSSPTNSSSALPVPSEPFSFSSGNATFEEPDYASSPLNAMNSFLQDGGMNLNISGQSLLADPVASTAIIQGNCPDGKIQEELMCVPCGLGTMFNKSGTISTCTTCPIGTYQDTEGQSQCITCPIGKTTSGEGSQALEDCKEICNPGYSQDADTGSCQICQKGSYQNEYGLVEVCYPCPDGSTTKETGATHSNNCSVVCPLGTELSVEEECKLCELGMFRDGDEYTCIPCSQGMTTMQTGSKKEEDCIWNCTAGQYIRSTVLGCMDCPISTYQPQPLQNECLKCDAGYTSNTTGAVDNEDCLDIDECTTGDHSCFSEEECVNTAGSYKCKGAADSLNLPIIIGVPIGGTILLILITVACYCHYDKTKRCKTKMRDKRIHAHSQSTATYDNSVAYVVGDDKDGVSDSEIQSE